MFFYGLLLIFFMGFSPEARCISPQGFSIDYEAKTLSWADDDNTWVYKPADESWVWANNESSDTWHYSAGAFENNTTYEQWVYDAIYDVWVNTFAWSYDLATEGEYAYQAWRYDADARKWFLTARSESESGVSFTSIPSVSWQYEPDSGEWQYMRDAAPDDEVPTSETWSFRSVDQSWRQSFPITGEEWVHYSRDSAGPWKNSGTNLRWEFIGAANDAWRFNIVGYDPGPGWDFLRWSLALGTGVWSNRRVALSPPASDTNHLWSYDGDSFVWVNDDDQDDTQHMPPPFAPTPFAPYKAVVDTAVQAIAAEGFTFGSSDGEGDGLLDALSSTLLLNGVFTLGGDLGITKMSFVETVTISGDIELHVTDDAILTLGDGSLSGTVAIKPSADAIDAQLIFNVDAGATLQVDVLNDVYFTANSITRLYVSFRGKGKTVFRLPSGITLSFGPDPDDSDSYGTFVQVLMDLSQAEMDAGHKQVVFEPWSYAAEDPENEDSMNTTLGKTTYIIFAKRSCLRFLSSNESAISGLANGYGSMAFDVCHEGEGRTVILLSEGDSPDDRNDAGINIWGSLVTGSGDDDAVVSGDLRTGVSANKRAGILAEISITDDVAYRTLVADIDDPSRDEAVAWLGRGRSARRGLVVVNRCQTYPHLAANLARAETLQTSQWAITQDSNGYQPGFILGDNGQIRIGHNLFLDYVAGSTNYLVDPEALGGDGATEATVKLHNASAFITDAIGLYAPSEDSSWDMAYEGSSAATIVLEGAAGLFFRCGASSLLRTPLNVITVNDDTQIDSLDVTIGTGVYSGSFCPALDRRGVQVQDESIFFDRFGNPIATSPEGDPLCLDGEHAIDFEGETIIVSVLGRLGYPPSGYLNIPSIKIDHTGTEIES